MAFIGNQPTAVPLTSSQLADGLITTAKLAADAVTSAKIADSTIVNADIASTTINLTQKVTGTLPATNGGTGVASYSAGNILYASNATTLATLAPGSSGNVLSLNGTTPSWTSLSSDFVKLATGTISSSTASISFDGYFTSDYNIYKFYWYNCRPVTNNGSTFRLRFRRSNADITASSYKSMIGGGYISSSSAETFSGGGVWNGTSMTINQTTWWISDTNYNFCGDLTLYDPLGTSLYKSITFNTLGEYENTYWYAGAGSGTLTDSTNALSGFTFLMNNSNISSGKFVLYGVKI